MAQNRVIGKNNRLPWKLPADLKHFRRLTMGKPIIMGRLTFESIGKPLDGRINIIITHDKDYAAAGCIVVHSLDEALQRVAVAAEAIVIGGAKLYEQMLPRADRIYMTLIHSEFDGDAYFPEYDEREWKTMQRIDMEPDDKNPYRYSFVQLQRVG